MEREREGVLFGAVLFGPFGGEESGDGRLGVEDLDKYIGANGIRLILDSVSPRDLTLLLQRWIWESN